MAIDSENKRRSVFVGSYTVLPEASGSVTAADRIHACGYYSGIAIASAVSEWLGTLFVGMEVTKGELAVLVGKALQPAVMNLDGTSPLTGNWDAGAFTISADTISATNGNGLRLSDDSDTLGIFIEDGGKVGIGTASPTTELTVAGDLTVYDAWAYLYLHDSNHGAGSAGHIYFKTDEPAEVARIVGQQAIDPGTRGNLIFQVNDGGAAVSYVNPLALYGTGLVTIYDTSNAKMTIGLTINQGGNDDEILAFRSTDTAHGITDVAETDIFGDVSKYHATIGGLLVRGFSDWTVGIQLLGSGDSADTAKGTAALAPCMLIGAMKSAAGLGLVGANGNVVVIRNWNTAVWLVDEDGDTWQPGNINSAGGQLTFEGSNDSGAVANEVTLGGYEIGAGNRVLAISQETAVAVEVDETKFSHKLQARINGVTYYMMLTAT